MHTYTTALSHQGKTLAGGRWGAGGELKKGKDRNGKTSWNHSKDVRRSVSQ